ncbi:MAG: DUF4329 domain-containing protein [Myxococcaceae bacterium]|nr:DUF4329 domain-containing protein [Myxococcaceae bacterium]
MAYAYGGSSLPAYAYALNNPIKYVDLDGLRPGDRFSGRWAANRAAVDALDFINPTSIEKNWEYGGEICFDPVSKEFFATDPVTDKDPAGCEPQKSPCPKGTLRYGQYHTHAAHDPTAPGNEKFSISDKFLARTSDPPFNSYLATPAGRYLKYYYQSGNITQLAGPPR